MSHVCKLNVMFLRDLVPFVQFKKREKHPSRSVTFSKVAGLKPATLLKVKLFYGCFSRFLNCVNGTKSHNASYLVLLEIWNLSVQSVFANAHYKKLSMIHFILWWWWLIHLYPCIHIYPYIHLHITYISLSDNILVLQFTKTRIV